MFDISYSLLVDLVSPQDYGLTCLNPFVYDYDMRCIYGDLRPHLRELDFDDRLIKHTLVPIEEKRDLGGYFGDCGVLIKSKKIKRGLFNSSFELNGKTIHLEETKWRRGVSYLDKLVLHSSSPSSLSCYDFPTSHQNWEVAFDTYEQHNIQAPLFLDQGLVIFNLGYHTDSHQGAIVCLDLATGQQQWLTEFDTPISNIQIVNEKRILAAHQGCIVELCPKSGDVLQNIDTELPEAHKEGWDNLAIYAVFDKLLYVSSMDTKIAVFNKDTLEKEQVIQLPDYMDIYATHKPLIKNGKVYWSLRGGIQDVDRPSDYLLMELTPFSEDREPQVTMEEKPPVEVSVVQDGEYESYQIDLKSDTPDQLIRFAEIEVQLVASNHGHTMWGAPALNKKFNGKIQLNTELPEGTSGEEVERATKYLHVLKEYWDKHTQEMGPKGSVKGSYIALSCFLNGSKVA